MDELDGFFDFGPKTTFKRETVPCGYVNGRRIIDEDFNEPIKRETAGTDYVKKYQQDEMDLMRNVIFLTLYFI